MWVKSLTGSNAAAGMTFFWLVLPSLFAPLFGLFVDRVRRRPLLVWANVASGVCVLPLLLVRDAGDVWLIYAVAFVYGISFVVVPAGLNGLLKEVMPPRLLVEANASLQTIKESFRLVGPLAGAALFSALGGGAVAVVDAASLPGGRGGHRVDAGARGAAGAQRPALAARADRGHPPHLVRRAAAPHARGPRRHRAGGRVQRVRDLRGDRRVRPAGGVHRRPAHRAGRRRHRRRADRLADRAALR